MNEIREVAMAYYRRATEEEKKLAKQFFRSLDVNGDGSVSRSEFKNLVSPWFSSDQVFKELDENGDGTLDFEEVLALYYMEKVPIPRCDGCRDLLVGSYFFCLLCIKDSPNSYDLCCNCFAVGKYQHRHSPASFVDNRAMNIIVTEVMKHAETSQADESEQVKQQIVRRSTSRSQSKRETAKEALDAFNTGVKIGNTAVIIGNFAVAAGCCIM